MKKLLFLIATIIGFLSSQAQQVELFQGYQKTLSGFKFQYHSPISENSPSLLSRAQADYQAIEWETEVVPDDFNSKEIRFIWAYGMDVTPDPREFKIYINKQHLFSISNPIFNDARDWSVVSTTGARLDFKVTKVDKHKDQMGFATLSLPRELIIPGESVTIRVDGQKSSSNVWFMCFTEALEEKFEVWQKELVAKRDGQPYYVIGADLTYLGAATKGTIQFMDIKKSIEILPGTNSFELYVPEQLYEESSVFELRIGKKRTLKKELKVDAVKEWTVYLVEHSHTDIGYTRPQTEILPEHLRYIDYALDYCDLTDDYPENAKFRWTCEASWPVREYLKSRPQSQIDRLIQRVKEGRIEVTGMFFNHSEINDESRLLAQLEPVGTFKENGIEVKTLMQNDVNGIGWALADYAQHTGIKYVLMGQHGHRARIPFKKPTAFWWESPSGKRLLAYRSEHYMHGNVLGLTSSDVNIFQKGLADYLKNLEEKNYPFTHTAFQFSGYVTDNSPPSTIACEVVRQWNELYEWPRIRLAIASEFMEYLEKNHADDIPIHREAWPDWWADGFGSAMRETQAVRNTQEDVTANLGLLSMARLMGADLPHDLYHDIHHIQDAILFYNEHTFGAAESISAPYAENSMVQWAEKSSYAWDAVMRSRMLKEKAMGFIQSYFPKSNNPSLLVFNTLNWKRSGLVRLFIDHEILPKGVAFRLRDNQGKTIEAQAMESRSDGTYWGLWVEDIPPMGYKTYAIELLEETRSLTQEEDPVLEFSNAYYTIQINKQTKGIVSIYDKELDLNLLDTSDSIEAGQFIYETLDNRHQMERYTSGKTDSVYVPLEGTRNVLEEVRLVSMKDGPIWKSLYLNGKMPDCADASGINMEIRLYHKEKRMAFHYDMIKLPVTSAEAVYVAFPFYLPQAKILFEAQGGMVEPGVNQLEGTSSDWNTIQHFAVVKNQEHQIVFSTMDIPLAQFGDINTGRFYYKHKPETSHIYSWVLNNYWTTNFKASQEGELKWQYEITSMKNTSNAEANRFGWASSMPFLTRVLPQGNQPQNLKSASLLSVDHPHVLLLSCQPDHDGGLLLHMRETEGKAASVDLEQMLPMEKVSEYVLVDALGKKIKSLGEDILLAPYESVFIKVKLKP